MKRTIDEIRNTKYVPDVAYDIKLLLNKIDRLKSENIQSAYDKQEPKKKWCNIYLTDDTSMMMCDYQACIEVVGGRLAFFDTNDKLIIMINDEHLKYFTVSYSDQKIVE